MNNLQKLTDEIMDAMIQRSSLSHASYRSTIASQQGVIDALEREIWSLKQELLKALQQLRSLSLHPTDWDKYHEKCQPGQESNLEE